MRYFEGWGGFYVEFFHHTHWTQIFSFGWLNDQGVVKASLAVVLYKLDVFPFQSQVKSEGL